MEKMTKVQKFNAIAQAIEGMEFSGFNAVEFLQNEVALIQKKAANKSAKKADDNDSIKVAIVASMAKLGKPSTVTEIMNGNSDLSGYTNQKISAVLRAMVADGTVVNTKDKKGSYFSLVESEEIEDEVE